MTVDLVMNVFMDVLANGTVILHLGLFVMLAGSLHMCWLEVLRLVQGRQRSLSLEAPVTTTSSVLACPLP